MENMQLIILMGGKSARLAPLSYCLPEGLLSINAKPAVFGMVTEYVKKGLRDITFVVSPANKCIVRSFAQKAFGNLNVRYVVQDEPLGPLHAFAMCAELITKPTLLLLGDTLCDTDLDYSGDWLGVMEIDDKSHSRWCLIKTDANDTVQAIIDKPDYTPETNKVLIGLYNFCDPAVLRDVLKQEYPKCRGEFQLSSAIEQYMKKREMKGMKINTWYDTGTLRDYNNTMRKNIFGRSFNNFLLDEFGVLTKTSDTGKLRSEIAWMEKVQRLGLGFLAPQFLGARFDGKTTSYKMEHIPGSTLAEYFIFHDITDDNWGYIFDKFMLTGNLMWSKRAPRSAEDITRLARMMYIDKTEERIKKWKRKDILQKESITSNGEKLLGWYKVFEILKPRIEKLIASSRKFYSLVHGDTCFGNSMFAPASASFKFLDPRGNFGIETIYGDSRYDVAKARHSYHGLADYISSGLYILREHTPDNFEYQFLTKNIVNPKIFDHIIWRYGFDVNDIELIEGLLSISLVTLLEGDPQAQVMYYLTGLRCLNHQVKVKG
jgi:dTDP-glucose pyrophosphorylase